MVNVRGSLNALDILKEEERGVGGVGRFRNNRPPVNNFTSFLRPH